MSRPRLLDLFCGGGGAAKGYIEAGFEVVGVDINDHSAYYPGSFNQGDALEYVKQHGHEFDAVHASPPCPRFSPATPKDSRDRHPDLVGVTREALDGSGLPWVMENVPQSPVRPDLVLCGSHFDLEVDGYLLKRHRNFELAGFQVPQPVDACRGRRIAGVYGVVGNIAFKKYKSHNAVKFDIPRAKIVMGTDIPPKPLAQAIPAAYTKYIGQYLLDAL